MQQHGELCAKIRECLADPTPRRLVVLGEDAARLAAQCGLPEPALKAAPAQGEAALRERADAEPADLALVSNLEALPPAEAGVLLAALRDLHARQVLVAVEAPADHWTHRDMLGYGFTRRLRQPTADGVLALYEFSIATYKTTPDWLSPKNWANPQHWDKYRW